ncbi:MAG: hypothetical protein JWR07_3111 [Nevskia sp.]|jgi:hypothetical protein|nr:hypothetical protein [Nevskia sp.]
MKTLQRLELLKDFIQEAVDRGATSVEQIHQHIAALPFDALEKSGLLEDDKLKLREKQRRSIGMVYDAIRRINREVGQLISDQFENVEDTQRVSEVLKEQAAPKKAAPARKAAAKKRRAVKAKT